jgi:hypothetical protein
MSESLTSLSSSLSTGDLQILVRDQHPGQDVHSAESKDTSSGFGCAIEETLLDELSFGHLSVELDSKDHTPDTDDDKPDAVTLQCGRAGYNGPAGSVSAQNHALDTASSTGAGPGFVARL